MDLQIWGLCVHIYKKFEIARDYFQIERILMALYRFQCNPIWNTGSAENVHYSDTEKMPRVKIKKAWLVDLNKAKVKRIFNYTSEQTKDSVDITNACA